VLALAGEPILGAEVDAVADRLEALSPNFSRPHLRRLALTTIFFPLLTARAIAGEERERASAEANAARADRVEGHAQAPLPSQVGTWETLGLEVWLQLVELEPGEWSPVFELPGAFALVRLIERDGAEPAGAEQFRAEILLFDYGEARAEIDQRVFEQRLDIVDPEWERIVPGAWKARMIGEA
jgi:hypothetical protein